MGEEGRDLSDADSYPWNGTFVNSPTPVEERGFTWDDEEKEEQDRRVRIERDRIGYESKESEKNRAAKK